MRFWVNGVQVLGVPAPIVYLLTGILILSLVLNLTIFWIVLIAPQIAPPPLPTIPTKKTHAPSTTKIRILGSQKSNPRDRIPTV